jgi:hypothetical protein
VQKALYKLHSGKRKFGSFPIVQALVELRRAIGWSSPAGSAADPAPAVELACRAGCGPPARGEARLQGQRPPHLRQSSLAGGAALVRRSTATLQLSLRRRRTRARGRGGPCPHGRSRRVTARWVGTARDAAWLRRPRLHLCPSSTRR